jgi:methionine-rich copper-binding protein CopC
MKIKILFLAGITAVSVAVSAKEKVDVIPASQSFVSNGVAIFKVESSEKIIIEKVEYALLNQKGGPVSPPLSWHSADLKTLDQSHRVSFPVKLKEGQYKVHFKISGLYEKDKKNKQGRWNENTQIPFEVKKGVVDPGEEGKKTLEGIDVDQDGIRDDIQVWIDAEYPVETRPSTNKGLRQLAKYFQLTLVNATDREKAMEYKVKALEAQSCLYWILGLNDAVKIRKVTQSNFNNTKERIRAHLMTEKYFHGSGTPESIKKFDDSENLLCEFEASKE